MIKTVLILALLNIFWMAPSFAANPQILICRTHGADFWSFKLQGDNSDEIGFCRYGEAYVGSQDLMSYFNDNIKTFALENYFSTRTNKIENCDEVDGKSLISMDSTGLIMNICVFPDGSYIGEETLLRGWHSDSNSLLNSFL